MGLKTRISLTVSALFAVLFVGVAVVLTYFAEGSMRAAIGVQHQALSQVLANELDRQIELRERGLQAAAALLASDPSGDVAHFQRFLDSRTALNTLFDGVYILSPEGRLLAVRPRALGAPGAFWGAVLQAGVENRGSAISAPFRNPATGEPMIAQTTPVRDAEGRVRVILAGAHSLQRAGLLDALAHGQIGKTGYFVLVSRDRVMLANPDVRRLLERLPVGANAGLEAALAAGRFGGVTRSSRGVPILAAYQPLQRAPWVLGVVWPLEEAYAPVLALRRTIFGAGFLLALLLPMWVWISVDALVRPLSALRDSLREMAANPQMNTLPGERGDDEIGEVVGALNALNRARDQAESLLSRMTHLYQALSQTNEAVLRAVSPQALFESICRIAVAHDQVRLAWVGLIDPLTQRVEPVARAGSPEGYLQGITVSALEGVPEGMGPTGVACRSAQPVICNDAQDAPEFAPWRQRMMRAGFRASAAFPFSQGGRVVGSLQLYTDIEGYFDARVIDLFSEMTSNIAFALDSFEGNALRRAAEQKLEEAQRLARIGSWSWDTNSGEVEWSAQMYELFGVLATAFVPTARTVIAHVFRDDVRRYVNRLRQALIDGQDFELEYRIVHARHGERWVWMHGRVRVNEHGVVCGLAGTLQDMTERKGFEEQLRLWARVFESASEGIMITDAERRIIAVNQAFLTLSGYSMNEVLGQSPRILKSGRQNPDFYRDMWVAIEETGSWRGELWSRRKNGEEFPEWLAITAVSDMRGHTTHYIGIFVDITERKQSDERIRFLAHFDPLTGLPNRALLTARLEMGLSMCDRTGRQLAVLFLDLDRFKTVNDSLGHGVGDLLLQQVAARIRPCVREQDTVARLGGDEFVVVLADIRGGEDAAMVASKILDAHLPPFCLGEFELNVSPSIGIAVYPDNGRDADTLIKNADSAMYSAKQKGRNNFQYFTGAMNAFAKERLLLCNSLRKAVVNNELSLVYQPQMSVDGSTVVGMEALLRWHHPEMGPVPPARFIPIAEEHGLIVPIGEWVLREACRQNRVWQDKGLPPCPVAVNLSALQFRQRNVVELIRDVLRESGLDPRWLELELTESLIMDEAENTIDTLHNLKAVGVSLAIDDFGTGYSCLSYLRRFKIDKLKIDRSFVQDDTADGAAIVKAVIGLAKTLNLRVIAEGVETRSQQAFLAEQGCDEVQGYLFSRPMPPDAITHFLRERLCVV